MKKLISLPYVLILALLVFIPHAYAEFPDSSDVELINEGIGLTFNEHYDRAKELFSELRTKYPEHPCGAFFMAATSQAEMKDYENFAFEKEFYANIDTTIELADKLRDRDRNSAWAYYFMGAAYLYRALYDSRKGGRWSPMRNGIRGKNLLEKCLELNPGVCDALAGLGTYRYWGEVKAGGLKWLPFIGGNREEGIENLIEASHKSLFSVDLAKSALIHVYIQEGKFIQADSLAAYLYEKYPEGKTFLWARAFVNFKSESYKTALEYFDSLENRLNIQGQPENYNLFEVSYYKMLCCYHLGDYDLALLAYNSAMEAPLTEDERKRQKEEYEDMEKCRENILEILSGK